MQLQEPPAVRVCPDSFPLCLVLSNPGGDSSRASIPSLHCEHLSQVALRQTAGTRTGGLAVEDGSFNLPPVSPVVRAAMAVRVGPEYRGQEG